jgi:predicted nucleic acid-binding protein
VTIVVDASVVVAALIDGGPVGTWADQILGTDHLVAPHLITAEAANILRRAAQSGQISSDVAALAHADLMAMRIELFSYEPFATRAWELREIVTAYDAWYVALAESIGMKLVTLDHRLVQASGPRCAFMTPPEEVRQSELDST